MKNIRKLVALLLLVALLIPCLYALAASKITLTSGKTVPSTVYVGKKYSLKVSGTSVKFYSSKKSVAIVGLNGGLLVPKAPGMVTITAKSSKNGKKVASKQLTVKLRADEVVPQETQITLAVGESYTLKAQLSPANASDTIKFKSADKSVATVSQTGGKITGKAIGKTTVTVYALATKSTKLSSSSNKTATVDVEVVAADKLLSVTQKGGYKYRLTFGDAVKNIDLEQVTVTRQSTNAPVEITKRATPDGKNSMQAVFTLDESLDEGDAFIFTYKKSTVVVKSKIVRAASIQPSPAEITLYLTDTQEIAVSLTPDDSTDVIRFQSADEKVAAVGKKSGLVTAKGIGKTQVTVYAMRGDKSKLADPENLVFEVPVTVLEKDEIASAEQTALKRVQLTFLRGVKGITADQISIFRKEDNQAVPVKSVNAVSGNPIALTAVLSEKIMDGKTYIVQYKTSQAEFTAIDNVVTRMEILPGAVMAGAPTRLYPFAYNQSGEQIYTEKDGLVMSLAQPKEDVQFKTPVLTMQKAGVTALIEAATGNDMNSFIDVYEIPCMEAGSYCFCEALFPSHTLGDGKTHDAGPCGQTDHFLCDGKDHGNAPCDIIGHFNCDGKKHERCPLCGSWLCVGEHGYGVCYTASPSPDDTPTTPPATPFD